MSDTHEAVSVEALLCPICGVSSPRYCGVCGNDLRKSKSIIPNTDEVAAKQLDEWQADMRGFVGSDTHTRTHRLLSFLKGFSGAYTWTQCSPAGDLQSILAALRSDEQLGWRPIETAPKDGSEFLAWGYADGACIMQVVYYEPSTAPDLKTADGHVYKGEEWCWAVLDGSTRHKDCFAHWQPLPAPPTADAPKGEA